MTAKVDPDTRAPQRATLADFEHLVRMFAPERYAYLGISIASLLALLGCAAHLVMAQRVDRDSILLFFGPTGLLTFTSGRLLSMFNRGLEVLGVGTRR